MTDVVLITGGNLGDVAANLERARLMLIEELGEQLCCSSVMRSAAWGFEAEEEFLNQVIVIRTANRPREILEVCHRIERALGRVREPFAESTLITHDATLVNSRIYASRSIDIDILFYGNEVINEPDLVIPHASIAKREFVLNPLSEVLPMFLHPVTGESVESILKELKDRSGEV